MAHQELVKTFATAELAVRIIMGETWKSDPNESEQKQREKRKKLMEEYRKLMAAGRIKFVTFHQSYGYEEFVEGIKPKLPNTENSTDKEDSTSTEISYVIKNGIFKGLCAEAEKDGDKSADDKNANIGRGTTEKFKDESYKGKNSMANVVREREGNLMRIALIITI